MKGKRLGELSFLVFALAVLFLGVLVDGLRLAGVLSYLWVEAVVVSLLLAAILAPLVAKLIARNRTRPFTGLKPVHYVLTILFFGFGFMIFDFAAEGIVIHALGGRPFATPFAVRSWLGFAMGAMWIVLTARLLRRSSGNGSAASGSKPSLPIQ